MTTKMKKTQRPPILPRDAADPVGVGALERAAVKDFKSRLRRIGKHYKALLDRIPRELQINSVYQFRLDAVLLASLLAQADIDVDTLLLEGDNDRLWFWEAYVQVATSRGIQQAVANLSAQSTAYAAERSAAAVLASDAHRARAVLVKARLFEDMKGLSQQTKADMARVLTEGVGRGLNPREIARNLEAEAASIGRNRAATIARTEVPTALRRARMDEADAAETLYAVKTKEMHISALSPTTRKTHADRHGKLFTREQQRAWWATGGNSNNCKCSTVAVLVDSKGNPLVPWLEERAKENLRVMKAKGEGPWTKDET